MSAYSARRHRGSDEQMDGEICDLDHVRIPFAWTFFSRGDLWEARAEVPDGVIPLPSPSHESDPAASRARRLKLVLARVRRVTRTPPKMAIGGTSRLMTSGYQEGCPGTGSPRLTTSHEARPRTIMRPANPAACSRGE